MRIVKRRSVFYDPLASGANVVRTRFELVGSYPLFLLLNMLIKLTSQQEFHFRLLVLPIPPDYIPHLEIPGE